MSSSASEPRGPEKQYSGTSLLVILIALGALRSVVIPVCYSILRYLHDENYSSANCLLKLVNSTSPDHFRNHPFYSSTKFINDCDLEKFVYAQFNNNEMRYFVVVQLFVTGGSICTAIFEWKKVLSLKYVIVLLVAYQLLVIQNSYSHFSQDVTFFASNIVSL